MKFPVRSFAFLLGVLLFVCTNGPQTAWCTPSALPGENAQDEHSPSSAGEPAFSEITLPGPLHSFMRMAAISQKAASEEVLPLLTRNIVVTGYQSGKQTEFLIIFNRYLQQARELQTLAGAASMIRVTDCSKAQPLLDALGYRMRQPCGPNASLEAAEADRAFLTIDSGFPLADLEETLRGGKPFEYPYAASRVPVLFSSADWMEGEKSSSKWELVDFLVHDPGLARLYWALSRMDVETAKSLRRSPGLTKLLPYAPLLDFFGSQISIRSGRVAVPGGAGSDSAWRDLVGAPPSAPGEFVLKLVSKEEGWLAAYFDALAHISQAQQAYFADPRRLARFYEALRGKELSPSPAKHAFRPDPGLFLLMTRQPLDPDGQPHIPGNVDAWRDVLRRKNSSKIVRDWGQRAAHWSKPEDVLEGMIGLSRVMQKDGPLQIYLSLSEMDRNRTREQRLTPQTVRLLADRFGRFGDQYTFFSEFPGLSNAAIARFITTGEALNRIPDILLRTDALGMMQANMGLWQILARQGQIPPAALDESWQSYLKPFAGITSETQLFDAGRASFRDLLRSATGKAEASQDEVIALLGGPAAAGSEAQEVRRVVAARIRSVMEDQRLVSLDTIFALGEGLEEMAKGHGASDAVTLLAGELREFEMPKPLFTPRERTELAGGLYNSRHTYAEMRTDLSKIIQAHSSAAELGVARGELAPFLRDTLVGLNYAYYEPPGAQMLHNNPLFVRTHDFSGGDFSGEVNLGGEQAWQTPRLFGRGWTASGGAHLVGSLADLPYTLAVVEQDFIVPKNVQSLIWEDLVPALVSSAVLPRWWRVTRNELHAAALYQRAGEELLTASAENEPLRRNVMAILSDRMLPLRAEQIEGALRARETEKVLVEILPSESFYLAAEYRRKFPVDANTAGPAGRELGNLMARFPEEVSWQRLSADFGVPHPALTRNYARELLDVKPFPAFLGYSSRLLAESWDSNNLYWARLADEKGYAPVELNRLIPELTRRMVEATFASHLEDWPAVLRAMRETGEEFRQGKIAASPKENPPAGL